MATPCDHEHDGTHGLAGDALAHAMNEADARLSAAGERLTPPRRRVLEQLLAAGRPIKAYDLIADYGGPGQAAKPPTVYRALDFLEREGLAHRIASISAYVACSHNGTDHAAAFLICDCCGDTQEIAPSVPEPLASRAAQAGYRLDRVTVEAHGLCQACQVA